MSPFEPPSGNPAGPANMGPGETSSRRDRPEEGDEAQMERAETLHLPLKSWVVLWAVPLAVVLIVLVILIAVTNP
jgi:hypothetical protein